MLDILLPLVVVVGMLFWLREPNHQLAVYDAGPAAVPRGGAPTTEVLNGRPVVPLDEVTYGPVVPLQAKAADTTPQAEKYTGMLQL